MNIKVAAFTVSEKSSNIICIMSKINAHQVYIKQVPLLHNTVSILGYDWLEIVGISGPD